MDFSPRGALGNLNEKIPHSGIVNHGGSPKILRSSIMM